MDTSNFIFVFGSDLLGTHRIGPAITAVCDHRAKVGISVGPTGDCYAIPTKTKPTKGSADALPVETIEKYVTDFLSYARVHPDTIFMVTPIGCGIAEFTADQIGPLFKDAPKNVMLPIKFHEAAFGAMVKDRVSYNFPKNPGHGSGKI